MIGVFVGGTDQVSARYAVAIAELPLRTRRATSVPGAIVVVSGARWPADMQAASAGGAAAVIVADPGFASVSEVRGEVPALDIPVIVERPRLRADVVADAMRTSDRAAPRVLIADAAATAADRLVVARDVFGWMRALAGDHVTVSGGDGALAVCETADGVVATVAIILTTRPRAWIRAHALGETSTQVEVEGPAARVTTDTRDGRRIAPIRFESSERLALRRALDAVSTGGLPRDIEDLLVDTECVERMRALDPPRT